MRRAADATLVALVLLSCSVEGLDLANKQCPCADGWTCDDVLNRCVTSLDASTPPNGSDTGTAPNCTIQHPDLLKAYKTRPPWIDVVGVDSCAGYPAGTELGDPAKITTPGVDVGNKSVTVTGSKVTLDKIDFTGWSLTVNGADTHIMNSKFFGPSTFTETVPLIGSSNDASNLHISNCVLDGNNKASLIDAYGPGLVVERSWLKNAAAAIIMRHGADGGELTIRYNLIEQAGMVGDNGSGKYLVVDGISVETITIINNTTFQDGGSTYGFLADHARTGEIANNTLIGSVAYFVSVDPKSQSFTVQDNYYDPSKALGFAYPAESPTVVYTNNVNMLTGKVEN